MDVLNIIIGFLFILLGIFLIRYYLLLVRENKHGGLSINAVSAGISFILIGLYFIIREI